MTFINTRIHRDVAPTTIEVNGRIDYSALGAWGLGYVTQYCCRDPNLPVGGWVASLQV